MFTHTFHKVFHPYFLRPYFLQSFHPYFLQSFHPYFFHPSFYTHTFCKVFTILFTRFSPILFSPIFYTHTLFCKVSPILFTRFHPYFSHPSFSPIRFTTFSPMLFTNFSPILFLPSFSPMFFLHSFHPCFIIHSFLSESSPENEIPFYFISTTLFPFFPNFLQNFKFFLSFCEPLVFTYKAFKTYFQSSSKFLATTYPI